LSSGAKRKKKKNKKLQLERNAHFACKEGALPTQSRKYTTATQLPVCEVF
jgi:hypothetical protein